jgi:hypothetical protein
MEGTMKRWITRGVGALALVALALTTAAGASAAPGYTLFDDASLVQPGHNSLQAVKLVSDSSPGDGGIDFAVPSGLTFAGLQTLSTDYNVTDDDCKAGSPRFQINVDTGSGVKNIFAYIGPEPNYTGCTPNTWANSGNLLDGSRHLDTSQVGGTFYDTYASAVSNYGSYPVVGIQLVVDSGWAFLDSEQTVLIDNTNINGTLYDYEPTRREAMDMCKNGGWRTFASPPGPFRNQGDCVSYFASGERNQPNP